VLLGGEMPALPNGAAGGGFPPGGAGAPPSGQNAPAGAAGQGAVQVASQPTAQPTTGPATPTEPVIRPTVISFPSATPTPVTQVISAEATTEAIDTLATCDISIIYNLNLRDQPTTDSTIYLSIPFGTTVVSDGRTENNWYRVSYDGQTGWVSGEFVSAGASCADIAVVEAD
jgi:Bacterial SH3 domain